MENSMKRLEYLSFGNILKIFEKTGNHFGPWSKGPLLK
jgi:hypothetical protein